MSLLTMEYLKPEGRLPCETDHATPGTDAVNVAVYEPPAVPEGRAEVVIVSVTCAGAGDSSSAAIVILNALLAVILFPAEACTVNSDVPDFDGVPEIVPFEFSVKPEGRLPAVIVRFCQVNCV